MSMKEQYSQEYRKEAVKIATSRNQSIARSARELGIKVKTLYLWIEKYNNAGKSQMVKDDKEEELKKLRKELAAVKQERDILKKATAYFSKASL